MRILGLLALQLIVIPAAFSNPGNVWETCKPYLDNDFDNIIFALKGSHQRGKEINYPSQDDNLFTCMTFDRDRHGIPDPDSNGFTVHRFSKHVQGDGSEFFKLSTLSPCFNEELILSKPYMLVGGSEEVYSDCKLINKIQSRKTKSISWEWECLGKGYGMGGSWDEVTTILYSEKTSPDSPITEMIQVGEKGVKFSCKSNTGNASLDAAIKN